MIQRLTDDGTVTMLNTIRLPARIGSRPTAALLGFLEHDIPILIAAKLLKALGNPALNARKYFSSAEIESLARDRAWLNKATAAVSRYWKNKNRNGQNGGQDEQPES